MSVVSLPSGDGIAEFEDDAPLIDPGDYTLRYVGHSTHYFLGVHKAPKLAVWFRVVDPGPATGTKVARYYNVRKLKGPIGSGGSFVATKKGDLARELALVGLLVRGSRLDRVPLSSLRSILVRGRVRTVTVGFKQRDRPDALHYSVIKEITGAETGPEPQL